MSPARAATCPKGSITLELIIAFAVASLVIASTILLIGSSDALAFEHEDSERALARALVDDALASLEADPFSVEATTSTVVRDSVPYGVALASIPVTPCLQSISSTATASMSQVTTGFTTLFADAPLMTALGGDCEVQEPFAAWSHISQYSGDAASGVAGTAVDVLGGFAYVGLVATPYLAIMDLGKASQGKSGGLSVSFDNGFELPAAANAVDAAFADGRSYLFAALATSTGQFAVIDVSDPANPTLIATRSLVGVKSDGADPAAYRVLYHDGRAYVTVRYIIGPQAELHIFDVSDPSVPHELGSANLETTVNGMAVRTRLVGGTERTYLYAAVAHDSKELAVYDVTNPQSVSPTPVEHVDLHGSQDGESVGIQGNTLYFGRASNTAGPELYAFDIATASDPVLISTAEIASKDITAVVPAGPYLFLAATADGVGNRMLQVWDITDPAHMTMRSALKDSGLAPGGIDYASQYLFAVGTATFLMLSGN